MEGKAGVAEGSGRRQISSEHIFHILKILYNMTMLSNSK